MYHLVLALTLLRIVGSLFVVYPLVTYGYFFFAGIAFIFFGLTDFLDGFLARKFKVTSHAGSILDPLADKCLFYAATLPLTKTLLPSSIFLGFLIRDLMVATLRECAQKYDAQIMPNRTGKLKTASVFTTIACALLFHSIITLSVELTYIMHVIFGFNLFMSFKSFWEYFEKFISGFIKTKNK